MADPSEPSKSPAVAAAASASPAPAATAWPPGEPAHPGVPLAPPGIAAESDVRTHSPGAAVPHSGEVASNGLREGLGELPPGYEDGRLVCLVRDPTCSFVYWDLSRAQIDQAFGGLGPARAALKLWTLKGELLREVEVHLEARSWYLRDLVPGAELRVELWALGEKGARMLRAARPLRMPPAAPSDLLDEQYLTVAHDRALAEGALRAGRARSWESATPLPGWDAGHPGAGTGGPGLPSSGTLPLSADLGPGPRERQVKGALAIVLHAHLPYVRHPEYPEFLEEDWLYEAITETYLPLLEAFDRLVADGIRFRLTMTLTPPLVGMLRDELLMQRYAARLDKLCELTDKEVQRTYGDGRTARLAWHYREHHYHLRRLFHDRYRRDLIGAFKRLQDLGALEIITCGATHGFLPLMIHPEAIRAQIKVAAAHYRMHFGRDPRGIWLPECGYVPGIDKLLAAENIRFFFVDSHAVVHATPRPRRGVYAPVYTPSGVAAFARDPESSMQVWSADYGYPGDPAYREFYRDIGYDLDWDYMRPYLQATGERKNVGIKYHRITGKVPLGQKELYDPEAARRRADEHAGNFLYNRTRQIEWLRSQFGGGPPPIVVAPYDAELYGHWWYEGPIFLELLIRKAAHDQDVLELVSPIDYLRQNPEQQLAQPPLSSWGAGGYAGVWLDESNDWIYRYLHKTSERMIELARQFPDAEGLPRRALNQAAREVLLAQASDWAFIIKTGTMVDYAVRRTKEHVLRFTRLYQQIKGGQVDESWLAAVEARDNLFPEIDYRVYQ